VTGHQVALWRRRRPLGGVSEPDKALTPRVLPVMESPGRDALLSTKDVELDVRVGPWRFSLRLDPAR
jgi:hypothetical protein